MTTINGFLFFLIYYRDFETEYLELLRRRFGTKRVHANLVYQEYISFREHIHMNSTQWETLTDFVKYLGKEGMILLKVAFMSSSLWVC